MSQSEDQQFCLRWNNFQANITSQFETLRDDEDFTDVTIACEGQRIQAHKVVLSACSPFFKELFKANPCSHPIIFMRDVEACHILALMEFMYAGEVNVSQAHLSTFLKTAESLKIRGLTDTSSESELPKEEDTLYLNPQSAKTFLNKHKLKNQISTSTVTSSQDLSLPNLPSPPPKRQCKSDNDMPKIKKDDSMTVNPFAFQSEVRGQVDVPKTPLQPKVELPDYISDDDNDTERDDNTDNIGNFFGGDVSELHGNDNRRLHSLDPRPCDECGKVYSNLSNLRQHMKLIHYPTYVTCPYCNRQFKTDLYLRRHIISAHDGLNRGHVKSAPPPVRAPATLKYLNIDALSRNGVDVKYGFKSNNVA